MGMVKNIMGGRRLQYGLRELMKPKNWQYEFKCRNQRIKRGWSSRDTWSGGEHIMEVTVGILRELETTFIDWDAYFEMNYQDNLGYKSLSEVADDIDNWIYWQEHSYEDEIYKKYDIDTRIQIEIQLYSQAQDGMSFVARNIGGLWW